MSRPLRAVLDAAAAVLLAGVLALVYSVERYLPKPEPIGGGGTVDTAPPPAPAPPPKAKLAVTPGEYDKMQPLLEKLGKGYRFEPVAEASLSDPDVCRKFDAIFLTCTKPPDGEAAKEATKQLAASLRAFVEQGGTLYASDLQFETLKVAFPEYVDDKLVLQGKSSEHVTATVVDPDLRAALGGTGTMDLHFDLDGWRPAAFGGKGVTVGLEGEVPILDTDQAILKGQARRQKAPLLVKIRHGDGTVIFTSFHNEKQTNDSDAELKLLNYLVLSTVTARVEAETLRELESGGFSPQARSLLSASQEDPKLSRKYPHARAGPLRFVLGFKPGDPRDGDPKFRLEVVSPDGKVTPAEGNSTLTVDINDATAGEWTCTVSALSVPYPNFPYRLLVAEPKPKPAVAKAAPQPEPPAGPPVEFRVLPVVPTGRVVAGPPRIGVTVADHDDVGKLLDKMGRGYKYDPVPDDDLLNPAALDRFDILFLTCSAIPEKWMESTSGKGERKDTSVGRVHPERLKEFSETLRHFVADRGGTLYASDYRVQMLYPAFPHREPKSRASPVVMAKVEAAERAWIDAKAPKAKVGTIRETLAKAGLGRDLSREANFDVLTAAVEASTLPDGDLGRRAATAEKTVRQGLSSITPPVDPTDVTAIARALVQWDRKIQTTYGALPTNEKNAARARIDAAAGELKEWRPRIFERGRGVGPQSVTARVVDPGLREALKVGDTIPLKFDNIAWFPARFAGDGVTHFLEGEFAQTRGDRDTAPLLVKFPEGKGTVIFTSFHNEKQNSDQETALLRYLVFTAVTEREEKAADTELRKGGFSPARRSLTSHSPNGPPSVPGVYRTTKPGPLRFALTFSGEGAKLKLALKAPNGSRFEQEAGSTLIVQTSDAPAGEWVYTVTPVNVPYEHFPYSVSVLELDPAAAAAGPK